MLHRRRKKTEIVYIAALSITATMIGERFRVVCWMERRVRYILTTIAANEIPL